MNAIMKYPGSKWSIAKWIIGYFPAHHSYLEPFFGSGAILFNKPRSNIETVNDLDGNVVNLFEWIKQDPERLAHEIYWTPYARQTYEDAFASNPQDSLEKAVNFYIKLNMGHGFRTNGESRSRSITRVVSMAYAPLVNVVNAGRYFTLCTSVENRSCQPLTVTNSSSLNGVEIMAGGSIIIPMDIRVEDTTMSMSRKGMYSKKPI